LIDRYASKIKTVFSCLDRVIITGTLPEICYAEAIAGQLWSRPRYGKMRHVIGRPVVPEISCPRLLEMLVESLPMAA
jgi:hypothetical protein